MYFIHKEYSQFGAKQTPREENIWIIITTSRVSCSVVVLIMVSSLSGTDKLDLNPNIIGYFNLELLSERSLREWSIYICMYVNDI